MNVVEQFKLLSGMSTTRRYSQTRLFHEESILEHTGMVAIISSQLAMEVNVANSNAIDYEPLNIGELLTKAIYHDAEESLTGDIPRPTKYFSAESQKAFEEVAEKGMQRTLSTLDLSPINRAEIYEKWKTAKDGREGMIIAIADLTCVVYKMWSEITMMGNKTLLLVCGQIIEYIGVIQEKLPTHFDACDSGYWYLCNYLVELKKLAVEAGIQS